MVVAGLSLYASWVNTAALAASGSHPGDGLYRLGLIVLGVGIYVLIAALSDSKWLPLPRKMTILRHESRQADKEAVRATAELALSSAIMVCGMLKRIPQLTTAKTSWWQDQVWATVANAWGPKESAMLIHEIPTDSEDDAVNARRYIDIIEPLLTSVSQRSHLLPVIPYASLTVAQDRAQRIAFQFMQVMQELNMQPSLPFPPVVSPVPGSEASPSAAAE